jgi:exodeoxyribonuclease VII large subunit
MDDRLILTVSELTRHIKGCLEPVYQDIWVEGEISNLRIPGSGHVYFTLKDEASQLRAVIFRQQARLLRFTPEDGLKVICRGRINVYEPRGEYQLLAELMEPKGIGELQLAFEQLKARLQQEGLFDPAHKRPLPFLPSQIALITSPTGAAVRDMVQIISRRFPNIRITVVPVKVQGDEAPDEIAVALRLANELDLADVLIVARGGGSIEDLWAFNTEKVARAIYASRIPVISAVGHEIDYTIADFVADLRAPTPSAAAELVVKEKKVLVQFVLQLGRRLVHTMRRQIERHRSSITYCHGRLRYPARKIADCRLRLDDLHMSLVRLLPRLLRQDRIAVRNRHHLLLARAPRHAVIRLKTRIEYLGRDLANLVRGLCAARRARLQGLAAQLDAFSPLQVMARGYSITRSLPSMAVVRDAAQLRPGDDVNVRLSKGALDCRVTRVRH